jgi:uncharacterized protein YcgI (DUF1989 family)
MSSAERVTPPPYGLKSYELLHPTADRQRFYREIGENQALRRLARELLVAARTGKAFPVAKGQLLRVECHADAQVADFDVFNRENPKECFSSSTTRAIHGSHLTVGHQLWSHPIYQRPMMTIVADTVDHARTSQGAKPHDILFGMCDERLYFRLLGKHGLPNCRDNLTMAIAEFGLGPEDVHDPLNIFMMTGLNDQGRLFYEPPRAKCGDYMELYADMDCLCAVSACPGASSGPSPGGLKLRIFDLDVRE